jgi:hypothetical protein
MKNCYLLVLLGLLFFSVSCKRTIEGEMKNFEANIQRLSEVAAKYPAFKSACETLKNDASKQMEAAKSLSEEKSKIAAMTTANNLASPTWVSDLNSIDAKINSIRDMATKAAQSSHDKTDSDAAWYASRMGEDAIRETKSKLDNASISNPSDAAAVVSSLMSNLSSAEKRLNDVVQTAEGKKNDEKKAEEDVKKAEDQKTAEEEKKKAPIKCGHCGASSPAGSAKCGGCGAPLS